MISRYECCRNRIVESDVRFVVIEEPVRPFITHRLFVPKDIECVKDQCEHQSCDETGDQGKRHQLENLTHCPTDAQIVRLVRNQPCRIPVSKVSVSFDRLAPRHSQGSTCYSQRCSRYRGHPLQGSVSTAPVDEVRQKYPTLTSVRLAIATSKKAKSNLSPA